MISFIEVYINVTVTESSNVCKDHRSVIGILVVQSIVEYEILAATILFCAFDFSAKKFKINNKL
jgi:hypothetical protein